MGGGWGKIVTGIVVGGGWGEIVSEIVVGDGWGEIVSEIVVTDQHSKYIKIIRTYSKIMFNDLEVSIPRGLMTSGFNHLEVS